MALKSKRKQMLLIIICCLVYSFAYAGRYSFNSNIAPIMSYYNVTRAEAGLVSTFFFFSYGVSQLLHAIFCKYYNKKFVIAASLIISSILNIVIFFNPPFEIIKYLWLINGVCQSALWPCIVLTLSETLEDDMMKKAVFTMSLSVMIGTLISYGGSALFNLFSYFQLSFVLGTILTAGIGIIWLLSYNTLNAEQYGVKTSQDKKENTKSETNKKGAKSFLILIAVCIMFAAVCNFVKDGLNTWTPVILKEQFHFEDSISIILTLVLPICGLVGAAFAIQCNKWIKDFRALSGFFYLLMSFFILGLLFSLRNNVIVPTLVCFGCISCLAHGINNVVTSIMPLSMREKINSGFLAGLMNAATYIGSTVSAYGLGKIADNSGWDMVIQILMYSAVGTTVVAGIVTLVEIIRKKAMKA